MRVAPADGGNRNPSDMPNAEYTFTLPEDGEYEIRLIQAPGGPVFKETYSALALSVNDGEILKVNSVSDTYKAGDHGCFEWCRAALEQEKTGSITVNGRKGKNSLMIYGCDPGAVLMRIEIRSTRAERASSFLGPIPGFIEN